MAYVPRTDGTRLVQVAAIEGEYPFYGEIRTDPRGGLVRASGRPPRGGGPLAADRAPGPRGRHPRPRRGPLRHQRHRGQRSRQRRPARRVRAPDLHPGPVPARRPGCSASAPAPSTRPILRLPAEHLRRGGAPRPHRPTPARRAGADPHGGGRPRAAQRDALPADRLSRAGGARSRCCSAGSVWRARWWSSSASGWTPSPCCAASAPPGGGCSRSTAWRRRAWRSPAAWSAR